MAKKIYVGNLPGTATQIEVQKLFATYGKVVSVKIEGGGRMAIAYVEMVDDAQASTAIRGLDNAKMGTNILNVNEARP